MVAACNCNHDQRRSQLSWHSGWRKCDKDGNVCDPPSDVSAGAGIYTRLHVSTFITDVHLVSLNGVAIAIIMFVLMYECYHRWYDITAPVYVLSFFVIYQPANVWAQLQLRSSADGVNVRGVLKCSCMWPSQISLPVHTTMKCTVKLPG